MVKYALSCFKDLGITGSVFSYGDNVITPVRIPLDGARPEDLDDESYNKMLLGIKEKLEAIFSEFGVV